jgi:hypothetical protein
MPTQCSDSIKTALQWALRHISVAFADGAAQKRRVNF